MTKCCCKGHPVQPLPMVAEGLITITGQLAAGPNYDQIVIAGMVPYNDGQHLWAVRRVWFAFGAAESGASGEDHTVVTFYQGDTGVTTGTTVSLSALTTEDNPTIGEPVTGDLYYEVDPGKLLFVKATVAGVGAVDFDLESLAFGFDLLRVRIN